MADLQSDINEAQDTVQVLHAAGEWAEKLTGCEEWGMFAFQFGETPKALISSPLYERLIMMPGLQSPHRKVSDVEMLRRYAAKATVVAVALKTKLDWKGNCYFFTQNGDEPTSEQVAGANQIATVVTKRLKELEDPETYLERILLLQVSSEETATFLGATRLAVEGVKRAHERNKTDRIQARCERALKSLDDLNLLLRTIADYSQPVGVRAARLNDAVKTVKKLLEDKHETPRESFTVSLGCDEAFEVQSSPGSLRVLLLKLTLYRNQQKRLSIRTAIEEGVPQIIIQDEDPLHIVNMLEVQAVKDLLNQCACEASCSVHPESGVTCRLLFHTNVEELSGEDSYPGLGN